MERRYAPMTGRPAGRTVIVGAGVTGLTIALQLARAGLDVTVLERAVALGGLARSFRYGPFTFDVGPHRFHTADAAVESFVRSGLGPELAEISRRSAVHSFGKLLAWPLRPSALAKLPPSVLLRAARDLVARRSALDGGASFEAEILARYGRTLYEVFFAPYTERFAGVPAQRLHRDWARAGVDRAVIVRDQRPDGLRSLLLRTALPAPREATFLYPPRGIGRFAERIAADAVASGARVAAGLAVDRLEVSGDVVTAVEAGGETIPCDTLVWTGSITSAAHLLGLAPLGLRFRSTVLYNLELRRPPRFDEQWVYFADDAPFVRVSCPTAFSRDMAPADRSSLCVECTCWEGDVHWTSAEERFDEMAGALVRSAVLASSADILAVHVERVPETYPIYELDYPARLREGLDALRRIPNLALAGRGGRFWYNNMDHSIGQALTVADALVAGRVPAEIDVGRREFWEQPSPPSRESLS